MNSLNEQSEGVYKVLTSGLPFILNRTVNQEHHGYEIQFGTVSLSVSWY